MTTIYVITVTLS